MPRGVYKRKDGQENAGRPGVPTGAAQKPAIVPAPAAVQPPPHTQAQHGPQQFTRDDFRTPIDDMSGALLKAFARSIGIQQRDVDNLTEDRLRQNCKARQLAALED